MLNKEIFHNKNFNTMNRKKIINAGVKCINFNKIKI